MKGISREMHISDTKPKCNSIQIDRFSGSKNGILNHDDIRQTTLRQNWYLGRLIIIITIIIIIITIT